MSSRRDFLKTGSLMAAGFMIVPRHVLGGSGYVAPSDRINLGYIGNGKMARSLLKSINSCPETIVLASCDVDSKKLGRFVNLAMEANKQKIKTDVKGYGDYRELLQRKDIDAVVVATPDHWHAQITIDAAKAGKDIYCEKPLSLTVGEGRAMVNAVRKYKRILQTGSMQRSMDNFRHAAELVINGYIGQIKEVNVSIGEPVKDCDLPSMPIPDYLNWDMWIGPSLYRGYNPILSPPIEEDVWAWWRGYRGFGGGYITDWGAHMFDIVQWALGMDDSGPVAFTPPSTPGALSGLSFRYANGINVYHKDWGKKNAIQFIGSEGTIEVARGFFKVSQSKLENIQFKSSDIRLYKSQQHQQDWVNAMKSRKDPIANVEVGHRTASVCNLVNIAYELQKPLLWNPKKEVFLNSAYGNQMLSRPYRGNWDYLSF